MQPMLLHDVGTGAFAAFGVMVALYVRARQGTGQHVDVSLSRTSVAMQAGEFTTWPGAPMAPTGRLDYAGDEPDHCLAQAADGWLAVAATSPRQRAAWAGIRGENGAALTSQSVSDVLDRCLVASIPAVRVLDRDEVHTSDSLSADDCWLVVDDDDLGEVRVMREYSRWQGVTRPTRGHMRSAGRDTEAVLRGLGLPT
jgi:crotonobetainyl-CoA:carnitine CoA-transferase CaiB-like acyl-CoA transferase